MLLSIIIPSYQQGDYLRGALLSIREQTFSDFEVLIMDAGSTDTTAAVVAEFNRQLPIIFQQGPDQGVYDAMNKGIAQARGRWLYFLGCDDRLYNSTVLQQLFGSAENQQYEVVYGDVKMSDTQQRYDGEFTAYKLMGKNICHQAIFVQKKVFDKVGNFNIHYKALADWDFNMRWFNDRTISRRYVPLVVAYYSTLGFSATYLDEAFYSAIDVLRKKYFPLLVRLQSRLLTGRIARLLFRH